MASTRARLTTFYSVALLTTTVAFAMALKFGRKDQARQALSAEVSRAADTVLATIRNAQRTGKRLTVIDSSFASPDAPSKVTAIRIRATPELTELLDPLPGYFMLLGAQEQVLYTSHLMRLLPDDDQQTINISALKVVDTIGANVPVRHDSLSLFLLARHDSTVGPNIRRVVAALPSYVVDISTQVLVGTTLAIAPIVLLISLAAAYLSAGSAFRPVDQLINEVEAITDGRSLHRRLAVDVSNDELSRLGVTVNAMLARLETSFGALRRFTADASHELKTPLTVLRADVERAMHPATSRADRMVALEEALQETARMADLVDSLLTLARADEGRFDLHRVPIELEPLVREVYETAVILGEDAGLTLTFPALENATVMGDRTRLRQLLLNLVTNAIKYTPRGGGVELNVSRRPNDEIAITVRDTGLGIATADLPHVFERFWRADRVRSRASERGGFGLGLSIAQWIVQAHGGSLTVQSRLGRGSIFTVLLPVVPEPGIEPEAGMAEQESDDAPRPTPDARDFTNS